LRGSRLGGPGFLEDQLAVPRVHVHGVAFHELALEQSQREWVLDQALDRALERAGAVGGVPAGLGEDLLRRIRQLEPEASLGEALADTPQLQLDDLGDLLLRERPELDDLVDPVEKLRAEDIGHRLRRAHIRSHDQDGVPEVDCAALAVGQAPVVEDLQQDVEDVRVGLLDLVEEDHRVRAPSDRFGQLAALLVADVPGRRADEPRDRVLLHVLAHVEADQRALVVEHELGERAGELGLADPRWAEEDEGADRAVRVLQAGSGAAERVRNRLDGLVLADDALVQALLHVDQLHGLALEQALDRDARPASDHRGDVVLVDFFLDHRALRHVARLELALELGQLAVTDLGDALELPVALGALGFTAQLVDLAGDLLDALELLLLLVPAGGQLVAQLLCLGELALQRLAHVLRLLRHRGELDLELAHAAL